MVLGREGRVSMKRGLKVFALVSLFASLYLCLDEKRIERLMLIGFTSREKFVSMKRGLKV